MAAQALMAATSSAVLSSSFLGATRRAARVSAVSNGSRLTMRASSSWLPGEPRPEYLDGSSPADYGFDPLRLGEVPSNLERHKEAELIHCRWAMLAIPGVLIPEALGLGNWVNAQTWAATGGQATYLGIPVPWGNLPTILAIEALAIAFVESQRVYESDPEKRKYPGGPFDPLGFAKDPSKLDELKTKELNNGRLALVAFTGFSVQAAVYPGTGPLQNLLEHIASPFTVNIANVLIPRSVY
jgi:light-harvesting complex I chlorophyll a/b binding protein 1